MHQTASPLTLVDTLVARSSTEAGLVKLAATLFVTALTAAAAQLSFPVPFSSVPFTLQPMVVLLGGLALGPRLGCASQVLYLMAGIAGLPVFATSAVLPPGALRLLGPTGGYLLSYPLAAMVVGYLAERGYDRRYLTSVGAMLVGLVLIYVSGVAWLGVVSTPALGATAGIQAALSTGVYPFFVADLVKVAAAAGTLPAVWHLLGRRQEPRS